MIPYLVKNSTPSLMLCRTSRTARERGTVYIGERLFKFPQFVISHSLSTDSPVFHQTIYSKVFQKKMRSQLTG